MPDSPPREAVLQEVDPDLNIFALANGLDLLRSPGEGTPRRVLEWYSDQMERRIVLTPGDGAASGSLDITITAEARIDGAKLRLSRPFQSAVAPGQLRETLPRAIEAGNAIARAEVAAEGQAP